MGNRLSASSTLSGISSGTFSFNADDLLTAETYDANGNTLTTGGKTFTYDSENRLKSMNGGAVSLVYDGDGNRVAKTASGVTTRYLVDDLNPTGYAQVVEGLVGTTVQREYTYGLQRISENQLISNTWTPSFYGYDGGGSVRQLTNSSGTVTDKYDYDAFGNLINSTGTTPNSYLNRAEQYAPDLGLYYLRARYYNPTTGRFLTRDPKEPCSCDGVRKPTTLHKYFYGNGDPVNHADPSGRVTIDYPLIGGQISLGRAVITGLKVLSAAVACADLWVGTRQLAYVVGGPSSTPVMIAPCVFVASRLPDIPRPGEMDAPFNPVEVITAPATPWNCDPGMTDCEARCPNGNTESLHFDPGIIYNEGPHWDYKDCNGKTWKIWPNGKITPA